MKQEAWRLPRGPRAGLRATPHPAALTLEFFRKRSRRAEGGEEPVDGSESGERKAQRRRRALRQGSRGPTREQRGRRTVCGWPGTAERGCRLDPQGRVRR